MTGGDPAKYAIRAWADDISGGKFIYWTGHGWSVWPQEAARLHSRHHMLVLKTMISPTLGAQIVEADSLEG